MIRRESPLGAAERAFFVSIILYGDEHADLFARCAAEIIVPADEVVVLGVDLRKGGGIMLAFVPEVRNS